MKIHSLEQMKENLFAMLGRLSVYAVLDGALHPTLGRALPGVTGMGSPHHSTAQHSTVGFVSPGTALTACFLNVKCKFDVKIRASKQKYVGVPLSCLMGGVSDWRYPTTETITSPFDFLDDADLAGRKPGSCC